MELSNLWDKFEFTTFERNNIVGIAVYCTVNSNYIYQLMPLSQAHITDASLTPEVATLDELVANEGTPVIVKNATVTSVAGAWTTDYFMFDEVFVTNFPIAGTFDLYGLYESGTFAVYNVVNVYGFAAISDLDTYVKQFPEAEGQAYNITEPVVVTHVEGDNVFVQYSGVGSYGQPLQCGNVLTGVKTAVKQGDLISGIKGISTPCNHYLDENWNPVIVKGASFAVAEDAEITVISSDNNIDYGASTEYAQLAFNMADRQGSAVKIVPVGTIVEEDGRYYYQETGFTYDEEYNQITIYYTVEFVSSVVDLSEWVGYDFGANSIVGVLDYMNTSDDVKFYVHGLVSNNIECQNIGEVLATGPLSDYTMTLSIANPVIVTYVYTTEYSAGLMVQDETGAIFVSYNNAATVENIKVGDAVTGILGAASWGGGQAPSLAAYNDNANPVQELQKYINTINKEITRKRDEFGLEVLDYVGQTLAQKRMTQAEALLNEIKESSDYKSEYDTLYNNIMKEIKDYITEDFATLRAFAYDLEELNADLFGDAAKLLRDAANSLEKYEDYK
jgi:hypothetical protein